MSTASILAISGISIKQDSHGRFCLNDLHKAAGGEKLHQPSNWLRTQQAIDLVSLLESEDCKNKPLDVINGGKNRGTFVIKELVYAYATWISAKFFLTVIRAYDSLVNPKSYGLKELPPSPYISNKEASLLSKAISSNSDRSQISKLYRKLYDGYGITEYKLLPSGKLDEALAFLGLRKPESKEMMLIAVEDFEKLRDKKPEMDYQQFIGHLNTLENCNMRLVDKRSLEILKYFLDDLMTKV